jgi:hypothetical protein
MVYGAGVLAWVFFSLLFYLLWRYRLTSVGVIDEMIRLGTSFLYWMPVPIALLILPPVALLIVRGFVACGRSVHGLVWSAVILTPLGLILGCAFSHRYFHMPVMLGISLTVGVAAWAVSWPPSKSKPGLDCSRARRTSGLLVLCWTGAFFTSLCVQGFWPVLIHPVMPASEAQRALSLVWHQSSVTSIKRSAWLTSSELNADGFPIWYWAGGYQVENFPNDRTVFLFIARNWDLPDRQAKAVVAVIVSGSVGMGYPGKFLWSSVARYHPGVLDLSAWSYHALAPYAVAWVLTLVICMTRHPGPVRRRSARLKQQKQLQRTRLQGQSSIAQGMAK